MWAAHLIHNMSDWSEYTVEIVGIAHILRFGKTDPPKYPNHVTETAVFSLEPNELSLTSNTSGL